jgi:NADH:ubiquinone oxidoreductase subunit K
MSVGLNAILVASAALMATGAFAIAARRNAVITLLGTQFMFAAGVVAFVAFGRFSVLGQTPGAAHQNVAGAMALFVGAVAIADLAVGAAMAVLLYRDSRHFFLDADGG